MNSRDWDFAFGSLGDPLADIEWWMTSPHPEWVTDELDSGEYYKEDK